MAGGVAAGELWPAETELFPQRVDGRRVVAGIKLVTGPAGPHRWVVVVEEPATGLFDVVHVVRRREGLLVVAGVPAPQRGLLYVRAALAMLSHAGSLGAG